MAFASIAGTATSGGGTSSSGGVALTLPSSIVAGEVLLVLVNQDNTTGTPSLSGGWTLIDEFDYPTAAINTMAVFAKIAAGSDTATLTGNNQDYAYIAMRIQDHGVSDVSTDIVTSAAHSAATASTTPNPPGVSLASADWLIIAAFGADDDDDTTPYEPTGYTAIAQQQSASSTSSCLIGAAYDQQTTAFENPPAFTIAAAEEWVAFTIAIPPEDTGPVEHEATMTGAWGALSGTASATTTREATLAGSWGTLNGTASATWAVLAGAWGGLAGSASATVTHDATLTGSWGALTGAAQAAPEISAVLSGSWGTLSGAVTATPDHPAVLSGAWGVLGATASATPDHPAVLAGAWGALAGAATVQPPAVLSGAWGALAASATATPDHPATLAGAWGALAGTMSATVESGGPAEHFATLDGAWGDMSATVAATPHGVAPTLRGAPTSAVDADGTASLGTLQVDKPAGAETDDLLLVFSFIERAEGEDSSEVSVEGFTSNGLTVTEAGSPELWLQRFWRLCTGDEGSTFELTNGVAAADRWSAAAFIIENVNVLDPFSFSSDGSGQSSSISIPQTLAEEDNSALLCIVQVTGGTITTSDPGNDWVLIGTFDGDQVRVFYNVQVAAGLTPSGTINFSGSLRYTAVTTALNLNANEAAMTASWDFTTDATATVTQFITMDGPWGALVSAALATPDHPAVLDGSWGELAGAASASTDHLATLTGAWGSLAGAATATTDHSAVLSGAWGTLTGTASASIVGGVQATLEGAWGELRAATPGGGAYLVGSTTVAEDADGTAASGTLDIDVPTGGAEGDLFLAIAHAARVGSFPIVTGTDFDVIVSGQNDVASPFWRTRALTKSYVGDEGATFTFTTSNTLVYWALGAMLIRGADTDTPVNASAAMTDQSGTSVDIPIAITDTDNCGLFFVAGVSSGSITTSDAGNGWLEVASFLDDSVKVFRNTLPTAGLTPEGTIEASESTHFAGFVVAFTPVATAVTVTHDVGMQLISMELDATASATVERDAELTGDWGGTLELEATRETEAVLEATWELDRSEIVIYPGEHQATGLGSWGGVTCELEADLTHDVVMAVRWAVDDFHMQGPGPRRRRRGRPKTLVEARTMPQWGLRDPESRTKIQRRTRGV